jgi:hypothetical protein
MPDGPPGSCQQAFDDRAGDPQRDRRNDQQQKQRHRPLSGLPASAARETPFAATGLVAQAVVLEDRLFVTG